MRRREFIELSTFQIDSGIDIRDIFVDYLKFEARFWFIALLMVIVKLDTLESERRDAEAEDSATKAA